MHRLSYYMMERLKTRHIHARFPDSVATLDSKGFDVKSDDVKRFEMWAGEYDGTGKYIGKQNHI